MTLPRSPWSLGPVTSYWAHVLVDVVFEVRLNRPGSDGGSVCWIPTCDGLGSLDTIASRATGAGPGAVTEGCAGLGLGPGSSVGQHFFYGYGLAAARRVPTGPQASHESTAFATLHPDLALLALGALVDGPLLA